MPLFCSLTTSEELVRPLRVTLPTLLRVEVEEEDAVERVDVEVPVEAVERVLPEVLLPVERVTVELLFPVERVAVELLLPVERVVPDEVDEVERVTF